MSVLDYWNVRSLGGVGLCWRAVSCDLRVTVTAPPGEGGCVGGWCTEQEREREREGRPVLDRRRRRRQSCGMRKAEQQAARAGQVEG